MRRTKGRGKPGAARSLQTVVAGSPGARPNLSLLTAAHGFGAHFAVHSCTLTHDGQAAQGSIVLQSGGIGERSRVQGGSREPDLLPQAWEG